MLAAVETPVGLRVITAPITTKHHEPDQLMVLPPRVAQHLKLEFGCGVVCNDLNRFTWVGPDVRATPGGTPFYGQMPAKLFEKIRGRVIANAVRLTDRGG